MPANDTQVGGAHYQGVKYQHWDFAIDAKLPYLEGQVTKYLDRAPRKNGRQDMEKALHFAQKLLESALAGRVSPAHAPRAGSLLPRYLGERSEMLVEEAYAMTRVTCWQDTEDLVLAISAIEMAIMKRYPPKEISE